MFNPTAAPTITDELADIVKTGNAPDTDINLLEHFDDPFTTGLVAQFKLPDTLPGGGTTEVLLFDQAGAGAPLTTANFSNYVNDGDYTNTIIHRSVTDFIIQGGGFSVDDSFSANDPTASVSEVPSDAPVENEFSSARSNVRGTIALAKLGNDPSSGTNQWFFNLDDNSENLDNQNGGFTVFGEVLSESDLTRLNEVADIPVYNGTDFFENSAFTDLPLVLDNPANPVVNSEENFVRYQSITLSERDELTFSVVNNSNPNVVSAEVIEDSLQLDYTPGTAGGTAEITVQATNLVGAVVEDTFTVTVTENNDPNPEDDEAATNEETPITIALADLLNNDDDPDSNDQLQIVAVDTTSSLGASVTQDEEGLLTYNPLPSETLQALPAETEAVDTFTYQLDDDNGGSATATVSVTVTGANDSPRFTSPNTLSVVENLTAIGTITATDIDTNSDLTFGLSGTDANALTLDPTGDLTFNTPADFENPIDANQDNIFEVQVSVSDGSATTTQSLTVTVTDESDNDESNNNSTDNNNNNNNTDNSNSLLTNPITIKTNAQGIIDGVVYKATATDASVQNKTVSFSDLRVRSGAAFDNLLGIYQVVDAEGGIDTSGNGLADIRVGDVGYAQAAIENRVRGFSARVGALGQSTQNSSGEESSDLLASSGFYAPFVIANGGGLGFDGFLAAEAAETDGVFNDAATALADAVVYFSFLGANPDGAEHIRSLGNNIFGFEDLPSNLMSADNDFNDALFRLDFS